MGDAVELLAHEVDAGFGDMMGNEALALSPLPCRYLVFELEPLRKLPVEPGKVTRVVARQLARLESKRVDARSRG